MADTWIDGCPFGTFFEDQQGPQNLELLYGDDTLIPAAPDALPRLAHYCSRMQTRQVRKRQLAGSQCRP